MTPFAACLAMILAGCAATPEEPIGWRTRDGAPVPDTDSQKQRDGFGGMLLVTPDADWTEKWDTPPEVTPHFGTATTVRVGETVTTLIFFVNPLLDESGDANVTCDLRVIRPDGSRSIDEQDLECYRGAIAPEHLYSIQLAIPVLEFVGEADDPLGEWITEVRLVDANRKVALDLKARFTLLGRET